MKAEPKKGRKAKLEPEEAENCEDEEESESAAQPKKNRKGKQESDENGSDEIVDTESKGKRAAIKRPPKAKAPPAPTTRPVRAKKTEVVYAELADDVDDEEEKVISKKAKKPAAKKESARKGKKNSEEGEKTEPQTKKKAAPKKGKAKKEVEEEHSENVDEVEADER